MLNYAQESRDTTPIVSQAAPTSIDSHAAFTFHAQESPHPAMQMQLDLTEDTLDWMCAHHMNAHAAMGALSGLIFTLSAHCLTPEQQEQVRGILESYMLCLKN